MAELWVAVTKYRIPVFCEAGVSHYVPAKVVWERTILDDGYEDIFLKSIEIIEQGGTG